MSAPYVPAWATEEGYRLTLATLQDLASRAVSVIEESEGADEHGELLANLRCLVSLCQDARMTAGELVIPRARVS